jgi:hypothetical protein
VQDPESQVRGLQVSTGTKGLRVDVESYAWSEDYFEFLFETETPPKRANTKIWPSSKGLNCDSGSCWQESRSN